MTLNPSPTKIVFTLESRLKRRSLFIKAKMENRQSRRKNFCSGKIGKVHFVEAQALQNCSRPHFSETHKNLVKKIRQWSKDGIQGQNPT